MTDIESDFVVVGGGIVGLSTAMQLGLRFPGRKVVLVEKEAELATHQTGHNSGVIHAGVYYAPGSLKARFCRAGSEATFAFAERHGIATRRPGKLIVATSRIEMERLATLEERCRRNGLSVERIDGAGLSELEPNVAGLGALRVAESGIVDYREVAQAMARDIEASGGRLITGTRLTGILETPGEIVTETNKGSIRASCLIACAGLQADRIARMAGLDADFAIVPFRGEYFRLASRHDRIVDHLIYPVPDPDLPFLGVHLTPMIGGYVTIGPNAVLSLAREGYGPRAFNGSDLGDMVRFAGFWRTLAGNWRAGISELASSWSRSRYLALCRRYAPSLELDDMLPHPPGIRAQAVLRDGTLVHDFLLRQTRRSLHVCNAPSPAATAAIPIGEHIVKSLPPDLF